MRTFKFVFTVECTSDGHADLEAVENMIDLSMQDLIFEDSFVEALDEKESVTIQVNLVK